MTMLISSTAALNLRHLVTKHHVARARREGSRLPQFLVVSELALQSPNRSRRCSHWRRREPERETQPLATNWDDGVRRKVKLGTTDQPFYSASLDTQSVLHRASHHLKE